MIALLLVLFICCAGCVQEQPMNPSEYGDNSSTESISRSDAVIIALSHPGVPEAIDNVSFQISVGELSVSTLSIPVPDYPKEFYVVSIERSNISTDEPLETLLVDVTKDGRIYKVRRMPPNPENTE
ncbi:MAG: hypothetical protein PHQ81_05385 [Methanofollis sp.]|nr:hypothetical protein [Methanofollis sp.]